MLHGSYAFFKGLKKETAPQRSSALGRSLPPPSGAHNNVGVAKSKPPIKLYKFQKILKFMKLIEQLPDLLLMTGLVSTNLGSYSPPMRDSPLNKTLANIDIFYGLPNCREAVRNPGTCAKLPFECASRLYPAILRDCYFHFGTGMIRFVSTDLRNQFSTFAVR